jgi:hypothetical protein
MNATVHLHWSYNSRYRDGRLLSDVRRGLSLCSQWLPRDQLTIDPAEASCEQCRAKAEAVADPAQPTEAL